MYIDFHNHLDFYDLNNMDQIIKEIEKNKIKTIACSMDSESYKENCKISEKSNYIIPTFGIHPSNVGKKLDILDEIDVYIRNSAMIGEIGLDFCWVEDTDSYVNQIIVFEEFLKLAKKYNKYINIHTKGAEEKVLELIKKYDVSEHSIIHWYSGDINILKKLINLNCYFTASIDLEYSQLSRAVATLVPVEKLLGETDGPTALQWITGEYGMPKQIINVYKNICKIKKIDIEEYKLNCKKTFSIMIK
ncbi:MAG: TatD family hydrolase [Paraclostridium sp.]|uniref:TatD family hydrolase n=1 Tax=Paraclostridium sp. TaxID=2023273 RepID=UPI003F33F49F